MEQTSTLSPVRYITEENGQRVGVVLTWQDYQYVQARLMSDADLLPGMNEAELRALAEGMLSPQHQERLSELLQRNRNQTLMPAETQELNGLLDDIDLLNILKARAKLTLHAQPVTATKPLGKKPVIQGLDS